MAELEREKKEEKKELRAQTFGINGERLLIEKISPEHAISSQLNGK